MAYVISDDCIACGTCIDECPVGAISEGDKYSIDPEATSILSTPRLAPNAALAQVYAPPRLSIRENKHRQVLRETKKKGNVPMAGIPFSFSCSVQLLPCREAFFLWD